MYQYVHDDDENTFQLVDSTRLPKPAYQRRPRFQQNVKYKNKTNNRNLFLFSSVFVNNKIQIIVLHQCKKHLQDYRKNLKQ
jgi:hypothetical protein